MPQRNGGGEFCTEVSQIVPKLFQLIRATACLEIPGETVNNPEH